MNQDMKLLHDYSGISRYAGVPTDQLTGRLHYNENLYGPSPKCMETLQALVPSDLYLYESTVQDDLTEELSKQFGIPYDNLFLHNGSAEIIKSIFSIVVERGDDILLPDPGWSYYTGIADYKFCKKHYYSILEGEKKCAHNVDAIMQMAAEYNPRLIIITTPAMPTGNKIADDDLERIVKSFPSSLVLVDEAYFGFAPYTLDVARMIRTYDNVVFSRTFSKYYGLANLRIGYGFCSDALKRVLWLDMPLHRLSHISKRMAIAALQDKAYYAGITKELLESREKFIHDLNEIEGVLAYESDANFIYIRCVHYDAEHIKRIAEENGFLIRVFTGNDEKHLRITIAPKETMQRLTSVLRSAFANCKC